MGLLFDTSGVILNTSVFMLNPLFISRFLMKDFHIEGKKIIIFLDSFLYREPKLIRF